MNKILESAGLESLSSGESVFAGNMPEPPSVVQHTADIDSVCAPLTPILSGQMDARGGADGNADGANDACLLHDWSPTAMSTDVSPEWPWMELFATNMPAMVTHDSREPLQDARCSGLNAPDQNIDEGQAEDVHSQEMANQLASRFGSLHLMQDGVLRFFGSPATTHLNMGTQTLYSPPQLNTLSLDRQSLLHNAGLDLKVEECFEKHLVDLFFNRHNKCRALLHEADYRRLLAVSGQGEAEHKDARSCRVLTSIM